MAIAGTQERCDESSANSSPMNYPVTGKYTGKIFRFAVFTESTLPQNPVNGALLNLDGNLTGK